jgi:choline kinase
MSDVKVIILSAGSGTRWGNHSGVPKHLIDVDGEPLLYRTARQFGKYTPDVTIVAPDDHRYQVEGCKTYIPKVDFTKEMDKFMSSMSLWKGQTQNVVLVYGDVYFTDEAVEKVMTYSGSWKYFCRPWESKITGKNCKEIFAIYVPVQDQKFVADSIRNIADLQTSTGGWSLFRKLTLNISNKGRDEDRRMFEAGCHVVIDDWTEDFDYPEDYDTWLSRRADIQT